MLAKRDPARCEATHCHALLRRIRDAPCIRAAFRADLSSPDLGSDMLTRTDRTDHQLGNVTLSSRPSPHDLPSIFKRDRNDWESALGQDIYTPEDRSARLHVKTIAPMPDSPISSSEPSVSGRLLTPTPVDQGLEHSCVSTATSAALCLRHGMATRVAARMLGNWGRCVTPDGHSQRPGLIRMARRSAV